MKIKTSLKKNVVFKKEHKWLCYGFAEHFPKIMAGQELGWDLKNALALDRSSGDKAILQEVEKLQRESIDNKKRIQSLAKTLDRKRRKAAEILEKQINRFPSLVSTFEQCTTHETKAEVLTRGIDSVLEQNKQNTKIVVDYRKVMSEKDK